MSARSPLTSAEASTPPSKIKRAEAITLVKNRGMLLPLTRLDTLRIASLNFGRERPTAFERMLERYAPCAHFSIQPGAATEETEALLRELTTYNCVIIYNGAARNTAGYSFGASKQLADLIRRCKAQRVRTIFVQQEFDRRNAELIAKETGTRITVINPLAYIRGRSLGRVFFIVDEAQNLTPHEIKTIITRAGEYTKIVFTGDIFQIDQPYLDMYSNGLTHLGEKMAGQELFEHVNLTKGERSELSEIASRLL